MHKKYTCDHLCNYFYFAGFQNISKQAVQSLVPTKMTPGTCASIYLYGFVFTLYYLSLMHKSNNVVCILSAVQTPVVTEEIRHKIVQCQLLLRVTDMQQDVKSLHYRPFRAHVFLADFSKCSLIRCKITMLQHLTNSSDALLKHLQKLLPFIYLSIFA